MWKCRNTQCARASHLMQHSPPRASIIGVCAAVDQQCCEFPMRIDRRHEERACAIGGLFVRVRTGIKENANCLEMSATNRKHKWRKCIDSGDCGSAPRGGSPNKAIT